jgi:hypothetical protein
MSQAKSRDTAAHQSPSESAGRNRSVIKISFSIPIPIFIMRLCVLAALLYRKIRFGYSFRRIKLTQGKYALVDIEDFEELNKYKWHTRKSRSNCYACRSIKLPDGRRKSISMHRWLINPPDGFVVDHKNRISLDNRRSNLRPATPAQNSYNRGKSSSRKCTSKYKGVSLNKRTGKWRSAIGFEGRRISLGSFTTEKQAALAYDCAAKRYHREFAYLNFSEKSRLAAAGIYPPQEDGSAVSPADIYPPVADYEAGFICFWHTGAFRLNNAPQSEQLNIEKLIVKN